MVWDENPEKPGVAEMTIKIGPADRNIIEESSALFVGDEANPLAQVGLIIVIVLLLVLVARRRNNSTNQKNWQRDDLDDAFDSENESNTRKPATPPPGFVFEQALQEAPKNISLGDELDIDQLLEGPELPPEGLPDNWTMEQWKHYGHEWLKIHQDK